MTLEQDVNRSWSEVENQYQRRADLVPNLVATVQGAATFEKETLTAVTEARASVGRATVTPGQAPTDPESLARFQAAQDQLGAALQRLLVVSERYPELRANQNFRDLLGAAGRHREPHRGGPGPLQRVRLRPSTPCSKKFPTNLLAQSHGFQSEAVLQGDDAGRRGSAEGPVQLLAVAGPRHRDREGREAVKGKGGRRLRRLALLAVLGVALAAAPLLADRYDDLIPEKPQRYVTDRAGSSAPERPRPSTPGSSSSSGTPRTRSSSGWTGNSPRTSPSRISPFAPRRSGAPARNRRTTAPFSSSSPRTAKVRIEVGYGLEGALPDITAKRIIEDEIIPKFRAGDYPGGIAAGAEAMMAAVKGEYKGSGRTVDEQKRGKRNPDRGLSAVSPLLRNLRHPSDAVPPPATVPLSRRRGMVDGRRGSEAGGGAAAGSPGADSAVGVGASPAAAAPSAGAEPPEAGEATDDYDELLFCSSTRTASSRRSPRRRRSPLARSASTSRAGSRRTWRNAPSGGSSFWV